MNKKYAIFDMDGTLIDSMVYWKNLGREYLALHGVTEDLVDIMERIKSMTMTESAELFRMEFHLPGTKESIAAEMNRMMEQHYRKDIPLKDGAKEYIKKLHTSGVKMCVASATDKGLMQECLDRLGIGRYFDFLLSIHYFYECFFHFCARKATFHKKNPISYLLFHKKMI